MNHPAIDPASLFLPPTQAHYIDASPVVSEEAMKV